MGCWTRADHDAQNHSHREGVGYCRVRSTCLADLRGVARLCVD